MMRPEIQNLLFSLPDLDPRELSGLSPRIATVCRAVPQLIEELVRLENEIYRLKREVKDNEYYSEMVRDELRWD